jgi:signal transduction histidine kinase
MLLDRRAEVIYDTGTSTTKGTMIDSFHSPISALYSRGNLSNQAYVVAGAGYFDGRQVWLIPVVGAGDLVIALLTPPNIFPLLRDFFLPLMLSSIVGVLGAIAASVFLSQSIARPISRLTRAADAVSAGDLGQQVPDEENTEVGRLVRSFNGMVQRLRITYDSQRQLLANIAHELRTPLTSIHGYAQALRDGVFSSDAERDRALATITEESDRVNALVVQILQLARLESGQSEPRMVPLNVVDVIDRITRRHEVEAELAGVELVSEIREPQEVIADDVLLDQAIDNLVSNALRHTKAGGRVTISAVSAVGKTGVSKLRIQVSDTGDGIPASEIPHIFDRFYRASDQPAVAGVNGGFGLGLAIVREIVVSHGGTVGVESQPDQGTTFTIDLPRKEKAPKAARSGLSPRFDSLPSG